LSSQNRLRTVTAALVTVQADFKGVCSSQQMVCTVVVAVSYAHASV
jgi:hypothetical protein